MSCCKVKVFSEAVTYEVRHLLHRAPRVEHSIHLELGQACYLLLLFTHRLLLISDGLWEQFKRSKFPPECAFIGHNVVTCRQVNTRMDFQLLKGCKMPMCKGEIHSQRFVFPAVSPGSPLTPKTRITWNCVWATWFSGFLCDRIYCFQMSL